MALLSKIQRKRRQEKPVSEHESVKELRELAARLTRDAFRASEDQEEYRPHGRQRSVPQPPPDDEEPSDR